MQDGFEKTSSTVRIGGGRAQLLESTTYLFWGPLVVGGHEDDIRQIVVSVGSSGCNIAMVKNPLI